MDMPMDALRKFPVRKTGRQKKAFQNAVLTYVKNLGYEACVEKGGLGVKNIVIGDPEHARYVVTAHYDTCARLPFPNLITPCSFLLFLAWQLFLVVLLCVPVGILGGLIGCLVRTPELGVVIAYLLLLAELVLMLFGPANSHNANDNTSGVVTVLETARTLPQELRDQVCFVLFDLEEGGLLGSAAYRKSHRKATNRQLVLNLDCVGEGDEIVLFPTSKVKQDKKRIDTLKGCCQENGKKSIIVRDQGFAIYPSDQANFPHGVGIAAFCRSKWAGLYLAKIHTAKDKHLDENNVALLRNFLIKVIQKQA